MALGRTTLGRFQTTKGDVLCLCLEDSYRRLQARMTPMFDGKPAPDNLHLAIYWPKLDSNGLEETEKWLDDHRDCNLIVIDTLAKVRPMPMRSSRNLYQEDYEVLSKLKELADTYEIVILVNHHTRKALSLDFFDSVSGTAGITGCSDTIWILGRYRNQSTATLKITGRDVEEDELALSFDQSTLSWRYAGEARDYRMSEARRNIIDVLQNAGEPLSPTAIGQILGRKSANIRQLLYHMKNDGEVILAGYGKYTVLNNTINVNNSNNTHNADNGRRFVSFDPATFA